MSARDDILARLRVRRPEGDFPLPDLPVFPGATADLLDAFKRNLTAMGGQWVMPDDGADVAALIRNRAGAEARIRTSTDDLPGFPRTDAVAEPGDLDDVDVGVVRARFGVAETGSVFLSDRELGHNTIAYLAQHLIVLLDPTAILSGIAEAYRRPDFAQANYVSLMTGPSATADIEGVLIRGAQGVRSLTVIFQPARAA
ncbi:LutC/YkgG family protein [Acidisoma sp. 7E03]